MRLNSKFTAAVLSVVAAFLPWLPVRLFLVGAACWLLLIKQEDNQQVTIEASQEFGPRFSRFRHDLLNDLQLVYGFVQLNKPMHEVLNKVDQTIARIRLAGNMFNINNWNLSCLLFDLWTEAELCGIQLDFQASGDWTSFDQQWTEWANGLRAVWAYYKGLAEGTGLSEVELTLYEEQSQWQLRFAAPGAPVAAASLPKKLRIELGSGAKLAWSHVEHSITLQVEKPA